MYNIHCICFLSFNWTFSNKFDYKDGDVGIEVDEVAAEAVEEGGDG